MFAEETARLKWRRGTRFGRPVLPLVCRTSATSSADGAVAEIPFGAFSRRTVPWSLISTENTGILRSAAALRASAATVAGQTRGGVAVASKKKETASSG